MFSCPGWTTSHIVVNVVIPRDEWIPWQTFGIEHSRAFASHRVFITNLKIVLESDVGFRATSPTANVITCCSVAGKAVVLKYISSSVIHYKCDAVAGSSAKK